LFGKTAFCFDSVSTASTPKKQFSLKNCFFRQLSTSFRRQKSSFLKKKTVFWLEIEKTAFYYGKLLFWYRAWALLGPSLAVPGAVLKNFWP
jgi:hypothetical protein